MGSFPNRLAGQCGTCGCPVAPKAGRLHRHGEGWALRCVQHADVQLVTPELPGVTRLPTPRVGIQLDATLPDHAVAAPTCFLGDQAFTAFKLAARHTGWTHVVDKETRRSFYRSHVSGVAHLVTELARVNIEAELQPALAAYLKNQVDLRAAVAASTPSKLNLVQRELAERKERLLPYQVPGIERLMGTVGQGLLLADDPGLGKTPQALLSVTASYPILVFTRASVVKEWQDAVARWLPFYQSFVYDGRGGFDRWPNHAEVAIGSYEALGDAPPPDCPDGVWAIIDEAHNFKNERIARYRKWIPVRDVLLRRTGTILTLTGTPLVNDDLGELWAILQLQRLGEREFGSKRFFLQLATERSAEFATRLKNVMLRRLKVEVLADLPPKIPTTVRCSITLEERRALDQALAELVEVAVERAVERERKQAVLERDLDPAALERRLQRAADKARSHAETAIDLAFDGTLRPPFELISRVKSILALAKIRTSLAKIQELEEIALQDAEGRWVHPIIFFSAHVEPVRQVGSRLGWAMLTGETSIAERGRLVSRFQAGELLGLALTIKAGGEGLNLQRSDRIVRNDREWTPAANNQSTGRAWRYGQTEPVQVFDVLADHLLDERILERNAEKEAMADQTVEQAVTRIAATTEADRTQAALDAALPARGTLAGLRRPPGDDHERAALAWARLPETEEGYRRLATSYDDHGGLTARQWEGLVLGHVEVTTALRAHPPVTARQRWIAQGLTRLSANPSSLTRPDVPRVASLVALLANGLTDPQWIEAAGVLWRYRRQIGEPPT